MGFKEKSAFIGHNSSRILVHFRCRKLPLLINTLSVLADISLADWGRKALTLAENEMPGLMHLRNTKITPFAIP
jgi:hypothetical protein